MTEDHREKVIAQYPQWNYSKIVLCQLMRIMRIRGSTESTVMRQYFRSTRLAVGMRVNRKQSLSGQINLTPLNRTKDTKKSTLQPFVAHSVKALVIAQRERGAYVKVVLQGLRSGRSAGGETIVVLIDAPVSQKFFYFSSRVSQLTSDGAELL